MNLNIRLSLFVVLLAWMVSGAAAADYKGGVRAAGLPVPGATVSASQGEAKVAAYTDEAGEFVLTGLAPGAWTVRVEMFGFDPAERSVTVPSEAPGVWELALRRPPAAAGAPPAAGETMRSRLQMNRAAMSEALAGAESQSFDPPAAPNPVSAQDANESFLVSGSLSQGLRMEQQNVMLFGGPGFGLMGAGPGPGGVPGMAPPEGGPPAAQPGMVGPGGAMGGPGAAMGGPGGGRVMVRGGPGGGPGFGGGPGAGGGRGPGGQGRMRGEGAPPWMAERGVALFGNRRNAGRESMRGSAFYSLNHSALDAKPYSLTGRGIDKPDYAGSRFGFNLGGPLRIPKLIDSPNTFIFLNYMGARSSRGFDSLTTVPGALERGGDFSASAAIYDPATGMPFHDNRIPASRIDPAARALLGFIPLPNLPGAVQNYQFVTSVPQNTHNLGLRFSRSLSARDRLSTGLHWQQRHSETAQAFGFRDTSDGWGLGINAGWVHNISASLINSVRLDYSRNRTELTPYFARGEDVAGALGIQGASRDPANYGPPNLSFTNFGALSGASASLRRDHRPPASTRTSPGSAAATPSGPAWATAATGSTASPTRTAAARSPSAAS